MKKDRDRSPDAADLRRRAEDRLRAQLPPATRQPSTEAENQRLVHELRVHQIELELQNEELREIQARLERSMERYADFYDFAPVGYFTLTDDGTIQELNLAGAALLGQERFRLIDRRFGLFVSAEARPAFNAFLDRALAAASGENCEIAIDRGEGAPHRTVHLIGASVGVGADRRCRLLAMDITARKRAEEALAQSETRFHNLLDRISSVSVQGYDADGTVHYWNEASETVYGHTAREAIGRNLLDLIIPPEMRPEVRQAIRWMAETGHPLPAGELSLLHKDGSRVEVFSNHAVVQIPGQPPELFCLDIDIAYRKRVEERIHQAQITYRGIIDSIEEAILIQDGTGTIIDANRAAEKICGYPHDSLIGKTPDAFAAPGKNDLAEMAQQFRKALAGKTQHFEFWAIRSDGSIYLKEMDLIPGAYFGARAVIAVGRDITERRRTDETLRAALAEQEVLLREVHHRVKNNLTAIIDLLELQRETMTAASAHAQLTELSHRIKSMALVHEMLYQSGNLSQLDCRRYFQALAGHLRDSLDPYGAIHLRVAAPEIGMNLDTAIPCGLIVNELVTNAFKHAFPQHRPRPGADACEIVIAADWDGATYTLAVTDNGVGLPAGLDWATTRTLGLRLVRMLGQHQLRGQIEFDGASGTRFTLRFNVNPARKRTGATASR